jgi:H+/Cl- antiporter ClcA
MEMTNDQEMLLALIITSFIAHGISQLVCPQPIYHALSQAFLHGGNKGQNPALKEASQRA